MDQWAFGANPALMVQVNYKQGPPAVLSNKPRQEGNCLELEHRGTQQAGSRLNMERSNFPNIFLLHSSPQSSQQERRQECRHHDGEGSRNAKARLFPMTPAGGPV